MIERRLSRNSQPATIHFGNRSFVALDWSPEGFRLGQSVSKTSQDKWYPVSVVIPDPVKPTRLLGQARVRWSNQLESGFEFRLRETTPPRSEPDADTHPANRPIPATLSKTNQEERQQASTTSNSDGPPVLTWVVKNGVHANKTKKPGIEKSASKATEKPKRVSRPEPVGIQYPQIRLVAPLAGRIDAIHASAGETVARGNVILEAHDEHLSNTHQERLMQQASLREKLEHIQQELIEWENRSRAIDADQGDQQIPQTRQKVAQAMAALNHAHERQKRCQAPMSDYQEINAYFRQCWSQHQNAVRSSDQESAERSHQQLEGIQEKLGGLRNAHTRTLDELNRLAQQVSSIEANLTTTVRAPFRTRICELYAAPDRRFKKAEALMKLENLEKPRLTILVDMATIGTIRVDREVRVTMVEPGQTMNALISEIKRRSGIKATTPQPFDAEQEDTTAVVTLELESSCSYLESHKQLQPSAVRIHWPTPNRK